MLKKSADAIILTDIDFEELNPKNRRKLFVAFSRARLHFMSFCYVGTRPRCTAC